MAKVERVVAIDCILGEGPIWDERAGVLWWLDIFKPAVNRFDPKTGTNRVYPVDEPIYAMALREGGGMVAAMESGIGWLDLEGETFERVVDPTSGAAVNFNDGGCDREGRFWLGTMAKDWESPIGHLYRFDGDRTVRAMDAGIRISNGLGWSPDSSVMYFTDSVEQRIFAYDYDLAAGTISNKRTFVSIEAGVGILDGMTVDAEGHVWSAIWDGWRLRRYRPDGTLEREIEMPVKRPTSVMFGGSDLSTLYVTSATIHFTPEELEKQPMAGHVFAVETGITGLPEPRFAG